MAYTKLIAALLRIKASGLTRLLPSEKVILLEAVAALESCDDQREYTFKLMAQIEKLEERVESQDTRPGLLQSEVLAEVKGWMTDRSLKAATGEEDEPNAICIWRFAEGQDKEKMLSVTVIVLDGEEPVVGICDGCGSLEHPAYHQPRCPRPGFTRYRGGERDDRG